MSLFDSLRHDAEGHPAQMTYQPHPSGPAMCLACLLETLKDPGVLNTCKCYAAKLCIDLLQQPDGSAVCQDIVHCHLQYTVTSLTALLLTGPAPAAGRADPGLLSWVTQLALLLAGAAPYVPEALTQGLVQGLGVQLQQGRAQNLQLLLHSEGARQCLQLMCTLAGDQEAGRHIAASLNAEHGGQVLLQLLIDAITAQPSSDHANHAAGNSGGQRGADGAPVGEEGLGIVCTSLLSHLVTHHPQDLDLQPTAASALLQQCCAALVGPSTASTALGPSFNPGSGPGMQMLRLGPSSKLSEGQLLQLVGLIEALLLSGRALTAAAGGASQPGLLMPALKACLLSSCSSTRQSASRVCSTLCSCCPPALLCQLVDEGLLEYLFECLRAFVAEGGDRGGAGGSDGPGSRGVGRGLGTGARGRGGASEHSPAQPTLCALLSVCQYERSRFLEHAPYGAEVLTRLLKLSIAEGEAAQQASTLEILKCIVSAGDQEVALPSSDIQQLLQLLPSCFPDPGMPMGGNASTAGNGGGAELSPEFQAAVTCAAQLLGAACQRWAFGGADRANGGGAAPWKAQLAMARGATAQVQEALSRAVQACVQGMSVVSARTLVQSGYAQAAAEAMAAWTAAGARAAATCKALPPMGSGSAAGLSHSSMGAVAVGVDEEVALLSSLDLYQAYLLLDLGRMSAEVGAEGAQGQRLSAAVQAASLQVLASLLGWGNALCSAATVGAAAALGSHPPSDRASSEARAGAAAYEGRMMGSAARWDQGGPGGDALYVEQVHQVAVRLRAAMAQFRQSMVSAGMCRCALQLMEGGSADGMGSDSVDQSMGEAARSQELWSIAWQVVLGLSQVPEPGGTCMAGMSAETAAVGRGEWDSGGSVEETAACLAAAGCRSLCDSVAVVLQSLQGLWQEGAAGQGGQGLLASAASCQLVVQAVSSCLASGDLPPDPDTLRWLTQVLVQCLEGISLPRQRQRPAPGAAPADDRHRGAQQLFRLCLALIIKAEDLQHAQGVGGGPFVALNANNDPFNSGCYGTCSVAAPQLDGLVCRYLECSLATEPMGGGVERLGPETISWVLKQSGSGGLGRSAELVLLASLGDPSVSCQVGTSPSSSSIDATADLVSKYPQSTLTVLSLLQQRARPGPESGPVAGLLSLLGAVLQNSPVEQVQQLLPRLLELGLLDSLRLITLQFASAASLKPSPPHLLRTHTMQGPGNTTCPPSATAATVETLMSCLGLCKALLLAAQACPQKQLGAAPLPADGYQLIPGAGFALPPGQGGWAQSVEDDWSPPTAQPLPFGWPGQQQQRDGVVRAEAAVGAIRAAARHSLLSVAKTLVNPAEVTWDDGWAAKHGAMLLLANSCLELVTAMLTQDLTAAATQAAQAGQLALPPSAASELLQLPELCRIMHWAITEAASGDNVLSVVAANELLPCSLELLVLLLVAAASGLCPSAASCLALGGQQGAKGASAGSCQGRYPNTAAVPAVAAFGHLIEPDRVSSFDQPRQVSQERQVSQGHGSSYNDGDRPNGDASADDKADLSLDTLIDLLVGLPAASNSHTRALVVGAVWAWMLFGMAAHAGSAEGLLLNADQRGGAAGSYPPQVLLMLLLNAATNSPGEEAGDAEPATKAWGTEPLDGSAAPGTNSPTHMSVSACVRAQALTALSLLSHHALAGHAPVVLRDQTPGMGAAVGGSVSLSSAAALQWHAWSGDVLKQVLSRVCAAACSCTASAGFGVLGRGALLPELLFLCNMLQPLKGTTPVSVPSAPGARRPQRPHKSLSKVPQAASCSESAPVPPWVLAEVADALKHRDLLLVLAAGAALMAPAHEHVGGQSIGQGPQGLLAEASGRLCCSILGWLLQQGLLDGYLSRAADLLSSTKTLTDAMAVDLPVPSDCSKGRAWQGLVLPLALLGMVVLRQAVGLGECVRQQHTLPMCSSTWRSVGELLVAVQQRHMSLDSKGQQAR